MRAVLGLVTVALLGGCSLVFDLSSVADGDTDNDGISDAIDNCPGLRNPDQSNIDGDELGDACDACDATGTEDIDMDMIPDACDGCIGSGIDSDANGVDDACERCVGVGPDTDGDGVANNCDLCNGKSEHDEDHDGTPDGCDLCPFTPGGSGSDLDGDMIAADCDPSPQLPSVGFFDAFTSQDPTWFIVGAGWVFDAGLDEYEVSATSASYRFHSVVSGTTTVSTRLRAELLTTTAGGEGGLIVTQNVDDPTSTPFYSCSVDIGGNLHLKVPGVDASGVGITFADQPFELEIRVTGIQQMLSCVVRQGNEQNVLSTGFAAAKYQVGVFATQGTWHVSYFSTVTQGT